MYDPMNQIVAIDDNNDTSATIQPIDDNHHTHIIHYEDTNDDVNEDGSTDNRVYVSGPINMATQALDDSSQLTLSFRGQVQAVLLLLGGCEAPSGSQGVEGPPLDQRGVQEYPKCSQSQRAASLVRFRQKRKERCFDKKVRYIVRQDVALRGLKCSQMLLVECFTIIVQSGTIVPGHLAAIASANVCPKFVIHPVRIWHSVADLQSPHYSLDCFCCEINIFHDIVSTFPLIETVSPVSRMQRNKGQFTSAKKQDGSNGWGADQESEQDVQSETSCTHCGISSKSTPMMRKGPSGPRTLCNACGLFWANRGTLRDISKRNQERPLAPPEQVGEANNNLDCGTPIPAHNSLVTFTDDNKPAAMVSDH
ncbi:hypothetical protein TanjilG_14945 [Lupinus angustifolius]|uniref:GATA-type domain-containing protein n=1 Tax=Lupinus angustifolius TaxID=3871 RepID=A0A1J7HP41_LUPAN|nr:hypothetical protein TanjilG_14945 [Lupinus angustifolius]